MTEQVLSVERKGAVDYVTLNRPDRLNALNQPLADALLGRLDGIKLNRQRLAC